MGREPADALFKVTHSQTAASTAVRQRLPLLAATLLLVPLAILPVVLLRKPPDKTVPLQFLSWQPQHAQHLLETQLSEPIQHYSCD